MATDKLVDFDHVTDYISREAAIKAAKCHYPKANEMIAGIILVPAADVVARDCYDRILAENDTMRDMLARIGKKCGDSMDDVRPEVLCRDCRWWTKQENSLQGRCELAGFYPTGGWFCANGERSNCGADMRPNLDTTKGERRDNSSG